MEDGKREIKRGWSERVNFRNFSAAVGLIAGIYSVFQFGGDIWSYFFPDQSGPPTVTDNRGSTDPRLQLAALGVKFNQVSFNTVIDQSDVRAVKLFCAAEAKGWYTAPGLYRDGMLLHSPIRSDVIKVLRDCDAVNWDVICAISSFDAKTIYSSAALKKQAIVLCGKDKVFAAEALLQNGD